MERAALHMYQRTGGKPVALLTVANTSPARLVPMPDGDRKPPEMGAHEPSGFARRLQPAIEC